MFRHQLKAIPAALLMLLAFSAPVVAQSTSVTQPDTTITIEPGSPWWAVIVISVVIGAFGLVFGIIRSYVNSKLQDERDERTAEALKQKNDFDLDLKRQTDSATQLAMLAASNNAMAASITEAIRAFATDRQQASVEREDMRVALNKNTDELARHAEELSQLRKLLESLVTNTNQVRELVQIINMRIGGAKDDPPLTLLLNEATEAAKEAAEMLRQAEEKAKTAPAPGNSNVKE